MHPSGLAEPLSQTNGDNIPKDDPPELLKSPDPRSIKAFFQEMFMHTYTSAYVRFLDKVNFNVTILFTFITVFLFAKSPDYYFIYWVFVMQSLLYLRRLLTFWQYGYIFYVIDYCYCATMVQAIFCFWYPHSRFWYLLAFSVGGIQLFVVYYKAMLVFHDIDKFTGATVHLMPFVFMYNIHWNIRGMDGREQWGFYDPQLIQFSTSLVLEYLYNHLIYYIVYCIFYYTIIFSCWKMIIENDFYCFYREQAEKPGIFVIGAGPDSNKYWFLCCFLFSHMYNLKFSIMVVFPFLFFQRIYTIYVLYLLYLLVQRGSQYYIDYFPNKYQTHLYYFDRFGCSYDPIKIRPSKKKQNVCNGRAKTD